MRLIELRLQNFRQHVDTHIHFEPGLTGILGPNGAGKSTLLEAIAWAIYGAEAARGTNDTIRFNRAAPRSRVEVELRFAIGPHEYRVVRSLNSADVFLGDEAAPVATTIGGVTRYLQGRLGMTRREFFNTYFTGQKELQFLATLGPADRGRFLSTVLGYERLRVAQELARQRRSEIRHEVDALRTGLGDLDEIRAETQAAQARAAEARESVAAAVREQSDAATALALVTPRWESAQQARDRFRELGHALAAAAHEREAAARDILRLEEELARVAAAEQELTDLRTQLAPLPAVSIECERLAELARLHERRRLLEAQVLEIEAELARSSERLTGLERAPGLVLRYSKELADARAEQRSVEAELEEKKTAWLRDRQDAETKLLAYRERGTELQEQVREIRAAGPEGKCPTCERPLGTDFQRVLAELEDEWNAVVHDGKWWRSRHEQLETKPEEVTALESRQAELDRVVEEKSRKHTRCEAGVVELGTLRQERAQRERRLAELRDELERIPAGYDRELHRKADARLAELRALETRAARLDEATRRRAGWERELAEVRARDAGAEARARAATLERDALGFAETAFAEVGAEFERTSERRRLADLRATELQGALAAADEAARAAAAVEARQLERAREIRERELDLRHHSDLDAAFSRLRGELNAQVRPELSELASLFLAQLTDGRYTSLEIDEGYNVLILDEGEEKPVISGGEEDIANLALRLSLSQMIAERAGHPLSLLILDEVFGSLDLARRDNVVQLLRRLDDRFDQVILITHVEGLRENLDQVLTVAFDERTGTSLVRQESLPAPFAQLAEGAAEV
jgi:exonuclease SbcC